MGARNESPRVVLTRVNRIRSLWFWHHDKTWWCLHCILILGMNSVPLAPWQCREIPFSPPPRPFSKPARKWHCTAAHWLTDLHRTVLGFGASCYQTVRKKEEKEEKPAEKDKTKSFLSIIRFCQEKAGRKRRKASRKRKRKRKRRAGKEDEDELEEPHWLALYPQAWLRHLKPAGTDLLAACKKGGWGV